MLFYVDRNRNAFGKRSLQRLECTLVRLVTPRVNDARAPWRWAMRRRKANRMRRPVSLLASTCPDATVAASNAYRTACLQQSASAQGRKSAPAVAERDDLLKAFAPRQNLRFV